MQCVTKCVCELTYSRCIFQGDKKKCQRATLRAGKRCKTERTAEEDEIFKGKHCFSKWNLNLVSNVLTHFRVFKSDIGSVSDVLMIYVFVKHVAKQTEVYNFYVIQRLYKYQKV